MTRIIVVFIILIFFFRCSDENYKISDSRITFLIEDKAGLFETGNSSQVVPFAEMILKSVNGQHTYTFTSDDSGRIAFQIFKPLLPNEYFVQAQREISQEEKERMGLDPGLDLILVNKDTKKIIVTGEKDTVIRIELEPESAQSPLIISEIYAAGPPEAGLYFHDKYVEIFNTTDSVCYLDGILIATLRENSWGDTENYVYTKNLWKFPGTGQDYPIQPGQFVVCAEDGMNHTIEAPYSVDLSNADFEFYKEITGKDLDYENVPNMVLIFQPTGNDWLIGGEKDAIIISNAFADSLSKENNMYAIPISSVLDGVEYLKESSQMSEKKIPLSIDAGATGGIEFYTGKSMERKGFMKNNRFFLMDQNNSSIDFQVVEHPTPQTHYAQ